MLTWTHGWFLLGKLGGPALFGNEVTSDELDQLVAKVGGHHADALASDRCSCCVLQIEG